MSISKNNVNAGILIPMSQQYVGKAYAPCKNIADGRAFYLIAPDLNLDEAWWQKESEVPLEDQIHFSANAMFFSGTHQRVIPGRWYACYFAEIWKDIFDGHLTNVERRLAIALNNGGRKAQLRM